LCLKTKIFKESKKKAQFSLEYQGASHAKIQGHASSLKNLKGGLVDISLASLVFYPTPGLVMTFFSFFDSFFSSFSYNQQI